MLKVDLKEVAPMIQKAAPIVKNIQKAATNVAQAPASEVAKKVIPSIVMLGGGAFAITAATAETAKNKAADPCSDFCGEIFG